MQNKFALGALSGAVAFLLITNPLVADAAGKITGKQIKDSSVQGKDIKDNSLTGADITETTLEKVNSAVSADTAKTVSPDSVTGASVADRSLKAADFAVASGSKLVDMTTLMSGTCNYTLVDTDVDLTGAAVVVSARDSSDYNTGFLSIHVGKSNILDSFRLVVCNVGAAAINPSPETFDYVALK